MNNITIPFVFAIILALGATVGNSKPGSNSAFQQPGNAAQPTPVRISIFSVGPLLGPPTNHYRVNEQIPIAITMTNTSNQPAHVCVSSDLYQDLPHLTKDGKLVPYSNSLVSVLRNAQRDLTCHHFDLPEEVLLKPQESENVDLLVLVDDGTLPTGATTWYERLTPGTYDLSIQRRLECCDGSMVDSNTISFEVEP